MWIGHMLDLVYQISKKKNPFSQVNFTLIQDFVFIQVKMSHKHDTYWYSMYEYNLV